MNRDYLAQQLDDVWWAAVVPDFLYPVQVASTEARRSCLTSQERGQVDQMAEGATEALGSGPTGSRLGLGQGMPR